MVVIVEFMDSFCVERVFIVIFLVFRFRSRTSFTVVLFVVGEMILVICV